MHSTTRFTLTALALAVAASTHAGTTHPHSKQLEEVLVTADFRAADAFSTANSLSVIDAQAMARRDARHLEQVLATAPNVNIAAGASRGRFLQIRGVGERSEFKDPLDASVGMVIDGIDYSGIGLAGMLFDVEQVDILRGPQGTQFGAAAMAGLVNIRSAAPTAEFGGKLMAGMGNYDTYSAGLMLNGALSEQLLGRIAVSGNRSDGFIDNAYLDRDNSNNLDEQAFNGRLTWLASDALTLGLVAHYLDADNGYNAFSLQNSRDIPADDPGHDRQRSRALAIHADWTGYRAVDVQTTLTTERSDLAYGFDWDWTNLPASGVRGSENNQRQRESYSADLRLLSKPGYEILGGASWVSGVYLYQRDINLEYRDSWEDIWDGGPWLSSFSSDFDQHREAVYGQLDWQLTDTLGLSTGLRAEQYSNDYADSGAIRDRQDDSLWGGKIALTWEGLANTLVYTSVSQGFKVGGVNGQAVNAVLNDDDSTPADIAFLQERQRFDAETLINYEAGFKGRYLDNTLALATSVFYMDRRDMQAKSYVLLPPANWKEYLDNVNGGYNAGLEVQAEWLATEQLTLFAALGYLESELGELQVQDVDTDAALDQSGRDQAHAPHYQYNAGATVALLSDLALTLEVDGKDGFYFSNSHNSRSHSYALLHASLAYELQQLSLRLWGRNLTDRDYETRGFYFDNTGSGSETYTQLGEPRTVGVTATYRF